MAKNWRNLAEVTHPEKSPTKVMHSVLKATNNFHVSIQNDMNSDFFK